MIVRLDQKAPERGLFFLLSVYTVFSYTVYPLAARPYTVIYTATEAKKGDPPMWADPLEIAKNLDFKGFFLSEISF